MSASWMQAFDVQMGVWRRWEDAGEEAFQVAALGTYPHEDGTWDTEQDPAVVEAYRQWVAATRKAALLAEPFFVSTDMCSLVQAASETFRPEPLQPAELLAPCGFLVFETPVKVLNGRPGDQIWQTYRALSWIGVTRREEDAGPFALLLTTYVQHLGEVGLPSPWDFEPWEFGAAPESRHIGWWRLAQTTFRLMLEFKPVSRLSMRPDRAARRRAQRAGFEEREVTVVRLRRRQAEREPLGGTADYSCRFLVSGHWRNQWYPSLGRHRQTWIAPYVKGPEEKPFRPTRGRAFVFTR